MNNDEIYNALLLKVEAVAGRKMSTPRDFDYLSMHIQHKTKGYIAPVTLKRFWGYLGDKNRKKPYRNTLDTLAKYAGYIGFDAFQSNFAGNIVVESDFLSNDSLQTQSLQKGTRIELKWYPDRSVTINYEGLEMFKVVESINSKLSVGDTFLCGQIIDGEPLTLRCLVHEGASPVNFVCGRVNGVKYRIL